MRLAYLSCLWLATALLVSSCKKSKDNSTINLSSQYQVDALGNFISGDLSDNQWKNKSFSSAEMALFAGLDTADLSGTTKPDSINQRFLNTIYPNPSYLQGGFYYSTYYNIGFSGKVVMKYVLVDSLMNVVDKGAIRLQAQSNPPPTPSTSNAIAFKPNTAPGRFRLYFTFSAASNEHFYKSWGNIQRYN